MASISRNHNNKSRTLSSLMEKEKPNTTLSTTKMTSLVGAIAQEQTIKALITKRDSNQLSKKSHFLSITTTNAMVRVKIPKLLAKTLRKKESRDGGDKRRTSKSWCPPKSHFHDKDVGSILSNGFGCKRLQIGPSAFGTEKTEDSDVRSKICGRCLEIESLKTEMGNSVLNDEVLPLALDAFSSLELHENSDIEEEKHEKVTSFECNDKHPEQISMNCQQHINLKSSLKKLLKKKINLKFRVGDRNGVSSTTNSLAKKFLRKFSCSRKKMSQEIEKNDWETNEAETNENDSEGDNELCKKKILMGEKCKPLNF